MKKLIILVFIGMFTILGPIGDSVAQSSEKKSAWDINYGTHNSISLWHNVIDQLTISIAEIEKENETLKKELAPYENLIGSVDKAVQDQIHRNSVLEAHRNHLLDQIRGTQTDITGRDPNKSSPESMPAVNNDLLRKTIAILDKKEHMLRLEVEDLQLKKQKLLVKKNMVDLTSEEISSAGVMPDYVNELPEEEVEKVNRELGAKLARLMEQKKEFERLYEENIKGATLATDREKKALLVKEIKVLEKEFERKNEMLKKTEKIVSKKNDLVDSLESLEQINRVLTLRVKQLTEMEK